MRKISKEAAAALIAGTNYFNSNTRVESGIMYLHGNVIAIKNPHDMQGVYAITLAGWPTTTTKERLNTLLDMLDATYSLRTVKGQVYACTNGSMVELDHDEYYKVKPLGKLKQGGKYDATK